MKAKELQAMSRQFSVKASEPVTASFRRDTKELSHYAPPRRDLNKPKPVSFTYIQMCGCVCVAELHMLSFNVSVLFVFLVF